MSNDEQDWLRRFLQAGMYQEYYSQTPSQGPAHNAPQRQSYPDPHLGIPSPFQALMSMTNNNPSSFFGSNSQPGSVMGPELAAAAQRASQRPPLPINQHASQHASQRIPQSSSPIPRPASQSTPPQAPHPAYPQASQRTQSVPHSGCQPAAQSASPAGYWPASQPAPEQARRPAIESASRDSYRSIPLSASPVAYQQIPQSSPLSTQLPDPQSAPEPAHRPAVKSASYTAYRPSPQPAPRSPYRPAPQRAYRPGSQSTPQSPQRLAPQPAHRPATESASQATYRPSPQPASLSPYRPASQFAPEPAHRPTPQPAYRPSPRPTPQSPHRPASQPTHQPLPQSAPVPAPPASTFESHPAPATIAQSLLQKEIQMPSAAPPPGPRTPQSTDQDHAAKKRRMENGSAEARSQSQGATVAPKLNFSAYKNTSSNKPSMFQLDVAAPFDEADAAEKIIYDPSTIARDVLITAGQHPTEPVLNYHLQHLRSLFNVVSASTDLETFRWDLVEAQSRPAPPHSVKPQQPYKPQHPQEQAPPPLIHRPPPQMQPLNTIKQQPPPAPLNWRPQYQPPKPHEPVALPADQPQPPTRPAQNPQPVAPPTPSPAANPPSNPPPAASPPKPSVAVDLTKQRPVVSPPKRSPGIGLPEQTPAINWPKKRGRPRSFQVEVPAPPKEPSRQASESKMAGKRQSQRAPAQFEIEMRVPYPVFACKWKNCQAELHNLDVFKQHMVKMHIPHHISCEWAKCPSKEIMAAAKLFDHVKVQHIDPIAWKLGDGPSVPATVDSETVASPGPLTRPDPSQLGGEDSLIFPASYSSIRAFNRVHKKNTPREKATEILKAVQRLKERIGVGLDPGGCELATPARNERVSNDEEVYELVAEG